MKSRKHDYDREDESGWLEILEKDSKSKRLKKFRKKRRSDRDSYKKRTPRLRSAWD